jgi:hypothetical protein
VEKRLFMKKDIRTFPTEDCLYILQEAQRDGVVYG